MMSRRNFAMAALAQAALPLLPAAAKGAPSMSDDPADYLHATRYLNFRHPRVQDAAASIRPTGTTAADTARAEVAFVRDEIKFGFAGGFWNNTAAEVLTDKLGYCNTKSTLFVALMRAKGIPARQVFVDIHASVLDGILSPGTPYVDHSYCEVFLDDAWRATDAYIADPALFTAAQPRLMKENRLMGYGVHVTGSNTWDGIAPSFSQFNMLDQRPISTRTFGMFEDVGDFYATAKDPWNRLNSIARTAFGLFVGGANDRAEALRRGG
ncbi:MAG: transglutaminase family protein [Candidatus Phaeomarinobacter sp.]